MTPAMALAVQQQALLRALYLPSAQGATEVIADQAVFTSATGLKHLERGLQAYRSHGRMLAQRVLHAAYPVLAELLSADSFDGLARFFWQNRPPACGDMAQWGGEFAAFIETLDELHRAEPDLADVARVEWALHTVATAADGEADLSTLALLATSEPSEVTLTLAPGTVGLESDFPVVSLVQARLSCGLESAEAHGAMGANVVDVAPAHPRGGVAESALVWRQGFKPMLRKALPGEIIFVTALQESQSLADSLSAAPELDFHAWLALAAHTGLLLGCRAV
jgi:Putative DNA-binding domain